MLILRIPYHQSNGACKKRGYCPGNVLSAGFTLLSAINHKKLHWDNPRTKQLKLSNASLERGVGVDSTLKERSFVSKKKTFFRQARESTRS